MTSKILYENNNVFTKNYDIAELVSVMTELQSKVSYLKINNAFIHSKVSHLEIRVKKLEKQLEKPKFEKLYLLFEKFGFLKFYAKFEKDYIDYETLKELCELKELKELRKHIPTIGEYLKFSKKIKEHFNQDESFDRIESE